MAPASFYLSPSSFFSVLQKCDCVEIRDGGVGVAVNFIYHFGWAIVPRYLVKHHSGCFCDGCFLD